MTLARDGWMIFFIALVLMLFTLSSMIDSEEEEKFEFILIDINDSEFFELEEDNNSAPIILNITVKMNERT